MLEVTVTNLDEMVDDAQRAAKAYPEAARIALNAGARKLARESSASIRKTLAFNPRELWSAANPLGGKITTLLASSATLQASVRGTDSPTPLSRFATNESSRTTPRVKVAPGKLVTMRRAFFLTFGNGARGLAIRLKPGERLINHRGPTYPLKSDPNVLILYAPSVDQALATAASGLLKEAADTTANEFVRQFNRLTKNG